MNDGLTNGWTFAILESLLRLKLLEDSKLYGGSGKLFLTASPSGHGKSQSDAVGAGLKRSLENESRRRGDKNPMKEITDLIDHLQQNSTVTIFHVSESEIKETKVKQKKRHAFAKGVHGCRKDLHVFRTVENSRTELVVASHGFSSDETLVAVATSDEYD